MAENVDLSLTEYNAFGPWVYEITERQQIPRLFAPYIASDDQAVLTIKVPREIERRDATPDMDLYDYVIALYDDKLRILERDNDKVKEQVVTEHDFKGIRLHKNMLKGACTIYSVGGAAAFAFNAVSIDLLHKFADLAIEKLEKEDAPGEKKDLSGLPVSESLPASMLMQNMLHNIKIDKKGIKLGAIQQTMDLYHINDTAAQVERMIWKELNPEGCHLYTEKELIVIENGFFPNRAGMPDFGYTYTIIPLNQISGVEIKASEDYALLEEAQVYLGPNKVIFHYGVENEEVRDFYQALIKI